MGGNMGSDAEECIVIIIVVAAVVVVIVGVRGGGGGKGREGGEMERGSAMIRCFNRDSLTVPRRSFEV